MPSQSIERLRVGSDDSATERSVTGRRQTAIPPLIQKSACQPNEFTSTPPINGPAAAPTAEAEPQ